MQKGIKFITLQGAIEKSPILLSQYWKNKWLDGNIIISYFDGSNNIFADCKCSGLDRKLVVKVAQNKNCQTKKILYWYQGPKDILK